MNYDLILLRLSKSKFRSSFHLNKKMKEYIDKTGLEKITQHAYEFIEKRIKPKKIINDGKQTPYKGHPIFIAQHACGCCCRNCLEKWHHISKNKELTKEEVNFIVNLLIKWIEKEYK